MSYRSALAVGCILLACSACGFKGPLYLPERNATVVTHAPAAQGAPTPSPTPPTSSKKKRKANQQKAGPPPPGTTPPTP